MPPPTADGVQATGTAKEDTTQFTTAVVTGAAGRIGRALATRLSSHTSRLVLADIDAAELAGTATELGASAVPTDVSDPRAVEALAVAATDAELVCLNAGIIGTKLGPPCGVRSVDPHPHVCRHAATPSTVHRASRARSLRRDAECTGRVVVVVGLGSGASKRFRTLHCREGWREGCDRLCRSSVG